MLVCYSYDRDSNYGQFSPYALLNFESIQDSIAEVLHTSPRIVTKYIPVHNYSQHVSTSPPA